MVSRAREAATSSSPERPLGQHGENATIRFASLFDGRICHAIRKYRRLYARRECVVPDPVSAAHALAWGFTRWEKASDRSAMCRSNGFCRIQAELVVLRWSRSLADGSGRINFATSQRNPRFERRNV